MTDDEYRDAIRAARAEGDIPQAMRLIDEWGQKDGRPPLDLPEVYTDAQAIHMALAIDVLLR